MRMHEYTYDDLPERPTGREERRQKRNRRRKRRHLRRRVFFFLLLAAFFITGYARFIEPQLLKVSNIDYTVQTFSAGSGAAETLRIAIFADTHFSETETPESFQRTVERINEEHPDLIFFLGDLVDDYSTYSGDISEIEAALASLQAAVGKYAVYGNHDYGGDMQFDYPEIMKAGGFTLLVNETVSLKNRNLRILGIDDMVIGYGNPAAAEALPADTCNIVLCHEPDVIDEMTGCNIDLMFAGHTHGRQINLSCFDNYILPAYGKKYVRGAFDIGNQRGTRLYVNAGIGMTKLPLRFGSRPEVTIATLHA